MRTVASGAAVVVMAKAPIPYVAKTRLRARLSAGECARLQEAFIGDALEAARAANIGPVCLAFWPATAHDYFYDKFAGEHPLLAQDGEDLGERMLNAVIGTLARVYAPVIVMGTDSPTLPPDRLREARSALERAEVCLGPASDGGYYLIGMSEPHAEAFRDIPWGSGEVLSATVARLRTAGLSLELLDPWYDVDTPSDLDRLIAELRSLDGKAEAHVPRRTRDLLLHMGVRRSRATHPAP